MPSQNTLVWAGAAASAIVIAGASALYWSHPDFLWWNAAGARIVGEVPAEPKPLVALTEPRAESIPHAPPATQTPPAPPSASAPAAKPPATPPGPAFDVVNVDPSGEAVVAGRAAPDAKVELRDAGKTVAVATADASGQFVLIPPALAPGDHNLSLAASADSGQPAVSSTVAVSVPAPKVTVAAGSPEPKTAAATPAPANPNPLPARLGMRTLATPAPAAGARVAIQSVEADSGGGLLTKGSADPHATVRLYLNQADVAEAKTQSDGHWSLTIKGGMTPGGYVVEADEVNPGATVVASANAPFEYPETAASTPPTASPPIAEPSSAPSPADPVVASVQTKRVATGYTLWELSKIYYGDPTHYPVIYEANRAQIHNPNVIFPGQVFVVPKPDAKP